MTEPVFPVFPGLAWPVTKAPHFATRVQRGTSGRELRVLDQPYPIWEFTLPFGVLRDQNDSRLSDTLGAGYNELRTLAGFISFMQGSFQTFLFDDPTDDTVSGTGTITGTMPNGDGTTTAFQLYRQLLAGSSQLAEPVVAPNSVTAVYNNGTLVSALNYSVSAATGIVTFTSAPSNGAALTWSGTFYFRCRFSADNAEFENLAVALWRLKELKFRSVLP